jgi:phosphoglycolate phosphatase-like HAD superfamily hydrolase
LNGVLFGLEGTLVESAYQQSPETIDELRTRTKREFLALGVPQETLSGIVRSYALRNAAYEWAEANLEPGSVLRFREDVETFMRPYDLGSASRTVLYPDTVNALKTLRAAGVEMGVVTNTSSEAAHRVLSSLGIEGFFSVVSSRNDVPRLKPDPAMIRHATSGMISKVGWLVGDSVFDAEAATNAGIRSIIVARNGLPPGFPYDRWAETLDDAVTIILGASP